MKILSIPTLAHDSSITIIEDGKIVFYRMEERFSRKKHDLGFDFILDTLSQKNHTYFDKVIISSHFLKEYTYPIEKIKEKIKKFSWGDLVVEKGRHHLYHAYSGFYNSGFDEAICFCIDASGAILNDGKIEIETVYHMRKNVEEKKIYQRTRDFLSTNHSTYQDYYSKISWNDLSVAEKFCNYSKTFGYNEIDGAGKIMGLAQYKNKKEKLTYPYNTQEWKTKVDKAYGLQQETQNYILNFIKKYVKETDVKNVVISGGYGLNCVSNYFYIKNLENINFYIDPICFDAGISIGCAYYHYLQSIQKSSTIYPLQNVYIGHKEKNFDLSNLETRKVSYDDVVDLLLEQKIISMFQGKSEAGQRSLGNRSLLFDSRIPNGKEIVNKIKKRENFRPFAGTILKEEVDKWFDIDSLDESPYMQYAVNAYKNAIDQVPAIIHADNTCRIQTVTLEQNFHFYNLISTFFKRTNVPMLLNTSFNLGGEPLVETFEQAIYTLKQSMIEYLYLPEIETLITIRNKKMMYQ